MPQWISIQREAFRAAVKLRRAFIDAGAFENVPFRKRIWIAHLQFVWLMLRPVRMQARSKITLLCWRAEELYCRTADRLFGGDRYKAFFERCERRFQETMQKLEEEDRKQHESAEARFDLRVLQESMQNPNFVVTNRPHQDRQ